MHLLLYLLKDDLVVPVITGLHENSGKEKFIQSTNLIHIHENSLRLLKSDDLFVEKWRLEIRSEHTKIANVILLGVQQLLDDHLSREKILEYLLDAKTGIHSSEEALDSDCGLLVREDIPCLHTQLISSF